MRSGQTIGRYAVRERLGEGGMGTVYRAHDPKLERDVAIKVIRPERASGDAAQARFLREARAMAKLSHSNVVTVYDWGVAQERPFVVMELVRGTTLADWLKAKTRTSAEIVAALTAAGQGLQAAHTAGLIHRDFKPSNVLIAEDGRVLVSDFGLARALVTLTPEPVSTLEQTLPDSPAHLTATGAVMGSPVYMAPEQHDGEAGSIDARADQFAFAVTLVEALSGTRLFAGTTLTALLTAKLDGPPALPNDLVWLRQRRSTLRRALHPRREERWPSMAALLHALSAARAKKRLLLATAVVGIGLSAVMLAPPPDQRCQRGSQQIAEIWNPARSEAVAAQIAASGRAHATRTSARVAAKLDDRSKAWSEAYGEACRSSEPGLDTRMGCLERQRSRLAKTIERLEGADAATVDRAIAIASSGAPPERCLIPEDDTLDALSPEQRELARSIRAEVRQAKRTEHLGQPQQALTMSAAALVRARALQHPPLLAFALTTHASALQATAHHDEAATLLDEAVVVAETAGEWRLAAAALIEAVYLEGNDRENSERALRLARQAEAALTRAGGDPQLELSLLTNVGATHHRMGDIESACASMLAVLEAQEQRPPKYSDDVMRTIAIISARQNVGSCLVIARRYVDALPHLEAALESARELYGADNPEVGLLHQALSSGLTSTGRYAEALEHIDRALVLWRVPSGPPDPRVAAALANRGYALSASGRLREAADTLLEAADFLEAIVGSEDMEIWGYRANAVEALVELGEIERAAPLAALARRRVAALTESGDPVRIHVAIASGRIALAQGDAESSLQYFGDALRDAVVAWGEQHPGIVPRHIDLAAAHRAAGDGEAVIAALEEAVALASANPGYAPIHAGEAFFELAKALADSDPARALDLGLRAEQTYQTHAEMPERLEEVRTWLAMQRG